jgi:AsmA protein
MNKAVKIITLSFVILLSVTALSLVALVTLVNPNSYKPLIVKTINDNTGRTLTLDGDISWKLWPNIGLHIEKVSLSNTPKFATPNLISVKSADISVQLLPLLHHSIIINTLALNELNLDLIKNGNLNNWTFNPISNNSTATIGESATANPLKLQLTKLTLTHATITYNDLKGTEHYKADDFDFKIDTRTGGTISLDSDKEIIDIKKAEFDFSNILKGNLNLNLIGFTAPKYNGNTDIKINSLTQLLNKLNQPTDLLTKPLFNDISLDTTFNGDNSNLSLNNTKFAFGNTIQGNMNIAVNHFSQPEYKGYISLNDISLNNVLNALNIKHADKNQLLAKASLSSKFNGNKSIINLQQLKFNLSNLLNGSGNIKIENFDKYSGDINLPTFSLNQVIAAVGATPINIPNKTLLNKVSLQSNFTATKNSVNLSELTAKVDNTNIAGTINASSIQPLKFSQDLNISKLELSDITNTNGYKMALTGVHAKGNGGINKNINSLNANQQITVNNAMLLGFSVDNFVAQMDHAITSTGKVVSLENIEKISNSIQVADTIKNMQAIAEKASTPGTKDYSKQTNLGSLSANIVINNGVANPTNFKLIGPSIKSNGSGLVNLDSQTLKYTVNSQLITPQKNDILNHIIFTYTLSGKIDNPNGSLDWISIQKQLVEYLLTNTTKQVKSLVKEQVNSVINNQQVPEAAEGIKQGVTNVINGLFK